MPAWGCVWQKATPALCQETSKHVNRAVHAYFNHWGSPSGSDCNGATATGTMLPLFADVGVAATLAAGLRVAGHNVVRMTPLGTLRMLTIITNRARVFYLQANLRQPRVRQLVEAHVLDLGQPRLTLVKGAGDVTTHGSPLGKWLLGRGRARRDRSARPDAAGAGALRPSATSEWGPRSLEHRRPGRPWALRSLVSPGLRALQRPESVKDSRIASQRKTATRVRAAGCSIDAALGLHILR